MWPARLEPSLACSACQTQPRYWGHRTSLRGLRAALGRQPGTPAVLARLQELKPLTPIFISRDLATTALNGYTAANGSVVDFTTNCFGRRLAPRTYGVAGTYKF